MQVQDYLAERGVAFELLSHEPTYSAQRLAECVHVRGDQVAKSVLLRVDGEYMLAVLPATHQIYLDMVRDLLDVASVEIADEAEVSRVFDDCESGVAPPFGSQYGLVTLVDASLAEDDEIVFEANRHQDSIRMKYQAYEELEHPRVAVFAYHVC